MQELEKAKAEGTEEEVKNKAKKEKKKFEEKVLKDLIPM